MAVTVIAYRVGVYPSRYPLEPAVAVYPYRFANGQTRWMFIIDLPTGVDGRRRQLKRKSFFSQAAAVAAEADARAAYGGAELSADGSLAAE